MAMLGRKVARQTKKESDLGLRWWVCSFFFCKQQECNSCRLCNTDITELAHMHSWNRQKNRAQDSYLDCEHKNAAFLRKSKMILLINEGCKLFWWGFTLHRGPSACLPSLQQQNESLLASDVLVSHRLLTFALSHLFILLSRYIERC